MFKRLFSARRWLALCGLITVLLLAVLALLSPQQLPVISTKPPWPPLPCASASGSTEPCSPMPVRPAT